MFKFFQKLGKAFMLPIALLPSAGLLLGIGGSLSNSNTVAQFPALNHPILQGVLYIMSKAGEIIFANLAMIMCIGLSIGLSKKEKGVAALASAVAFLVMNSSLAAMIKVIAPEIVSIDTGVVGAIVVALMVSTFNEKYHNINLPSYLGFFGGSRFIPLISSLMAIVLAFIFFLIWPPFQSVLLVIGKSLANLGTIGTFLYGFLLRLTGAIGLHHIVYSLFWFTEIGGVAEVAGQTVVGAQKIFFAQLADPSHQGLFTNGTRFFAGRFATMMFGLPAACLAMYHSVDKNKRSKVIGIFLSAALTSFLTGITEPIEFMFLFVAPWLYVLHSFYDGLSFFMADLLEIRIGNTFSGGLIDFTLFGVLQGNDKTNFIRVIPLGLAWIILYYFSFKLLITKFNVATPGRFEETDDDIQIETKSTLTQTALEIIDALGQKNNIEDVDACISRLRVTVKNSSLVNKDKLKTLGASGVIDVQGGIQAIFGTKSDLLKTQINSILEQQE